MEPDTPVRQTVTKVAGAGLSHRRGTGPCPSETGQGRLATLVS